MDEKNKEKLSYICIIYSMYYFGTALSQLTNQALKPST